jgi:uncharacterized protein (UPF0333 family)
VNLSEPCIGHYVKLSQAEASAGLEVLLLLLVVVVVVVPLESFCMAMHVSGSIKLGCVL